ncbi:MAG: hypothetical protein HC850_03830 [Rhodomicrobium sp.]|nr:hypothetical protein [Rhodomicrobium sp.]
MARPREFDTDEAIEKAMQVFWEKGHGAALPDLLGGMEIARGSFYKAFSDKKSVYLMALAIMTARCSPPRLPGSRMGASPMAANALNACSAALPTALARATGAAVFSGIPPPAPQWTIPISAARFSR